MGWWKYGFVLVVVLLVDVFKSTETADLSSNKNLHASTHLKAKIADEKKNNSSSVDNLSNPITVGDLHNNRLSRDLSKESTFNSGSNGAEVSKQKTQSSSVKGTFMIPYMRPGRNLEPPSVAIEDDDYISIETENSSDELFKRGSDSMIPMMRVGRASESSSKNSMIPSLRFGRSDHGSEIERQYTVVPMLRVGRLPKVTSRRKYNYLKSKGRLDPSERLKDADPNVVLQYIRPGRSVMLHEDNKLNNYEFQQDNEIDAQLAHIFEDEVYDVPESLLDQFGDEEYLESVVTKRDNSANGTVIPYPRLGRSDEDMTAYDILNSKRQMIPQIRFGRSSDEESGKIVNPKFVNYMVPYPRPGRTEKTLKIKSELNPNSYSVIPYPRPGRSDESIEVESDVFIGKGKRQGYMTPTLRVDRSLDNNGENDFTNTQTPSLRLRRSEEIDDEVILMEDEMGEVNPLFLPLSQKYTPKEYKENLLKYEESGSHFIIPYPRPGKRVSNAFKSNSDEDNVDELESVSQSMLQLTESEDVDGGDLSEDSNEENADYSSFDINDQENNYPDSIYFSKRNTLKTDKFISPEYVKFKTTQKPEYILPYPRPGRSTSQNKFMIPYARMGRSNLAYEPSVLPEQDKKSSNFIVPYPRAGRSSLEPDSSNYMIPYPRPGRSKNPSNLFKYNPKASLKDNYIVPYPRPGRSQSTSSKSSVKYPVKEAYIVPYPRPGRSDKSPKNPQHASKYSYKDLYVLPYPRPGRSSQELMIPYPRPGRSSQGSMIPYPRPGRSSQGLIIPYPRPGRSSQGSVVPYPRPGRSSQGSMVPYPRPGRSNQGLVIPSPRPGRSSQGTMVPYPRPGRSNDKQKITLLASKLLNNKDKYILPYPRPGRSNQWSVVPYPRPGRSSQGSVVPYPRPGRSSQGSVVPYPRPGRSEQDEFSEDVIQEEEMYRQLRSDTNSTNEEGSSSSSQNTVIPYPRLGRSELIETRPLSRIRTGSMHKLDKHMVADGNSKYLLPYPRPGRDTY